MVCTRAFHRIETHNGEGQREELQIIIDVPMVYIFSIQRGNWEANWDGAVTVPEGRGSGDRGILGPNVGRLPGDQIQQEDLVPTAKRLMSILPSFK